MSCSQEQARIDVQGVSDGNQDADAEIGLPCFDALEKGQIDAGRFREPFLGQMSLCAMSPDIGGNVQ